MKKIIFAFLSLSIIFSACVSQKEHEGSQKDQSPASDAFQSETGGENADGLQTEASSGFPFAFFAADLYGNPVTEASLGEKEIYFVHYWATWCPPCVAEMPDFPQIIEQYGGRVGFIALVEDYKSNLAGAVKIVESAGIPSSFIMVDESSPGLEPVLSMLRSGYVPTTVLLDNKGNNLEEIIGAYGAGYSVFLDKWLD
ncbi:MAG: TlpA family protein disulfide reductase [Defluviitaleaceae bacterium]|nr:TlpA family protein disulfide reductase [Defluviitaleaceae bacterium]